MKQTLMQYIVCPSCGTGFQLREVGEGEKGEIDSALLVCQNGHSFAVTNGVPRLLIENKIEDNEAVETIKSFAEKWARIPNYGHDDETRDFQLSWYLQRYGWDSREDLTHFLSSKQFILDAGTGLGRDTRLYAENTKGEVFGIDITRSVDVAYRYLVHLPNAHLIQADLTALPFPKDLFDFIASDQVIHHTPNTEASFKYLVDFLRPGGQIAVYIYRKKGPIREFCDDYIRDYTTKMQPDECRRFSESITKLGKSLSGQKYEIIIPDDIPMLEIKAGTYDLQRFIYWNIFKCFWNNDFDFETNVMVNFDWYHPQYAWRHTPEEVRQWFEDMNLDILNFDVIESGISGRGMKCAE